MNQESKLQLHELKNRVRQASIAQIGGFRPSGNPISSWFGKGVGLPSESLPLWNGKPMFPLLQILTSDLPVIPDSLRGIELLTLFHNQESHPFDLPHGEGWLIREYTSLANLVPLPEIHSPYKIRPFPIIWTLIDDDAPGWEDASEVVDMDLICADLDASEEFSTSFNRYPGTKVGGFPYEIQHGVGLGDFVFQVGSEEKSNWMWVDNGIGYFFKSITGIWSWSCQFY